MKGYNKNKRILLFFPLSKWEISIQTFHSWSWIVMTQEMIFHFSELKYLSLKGRKAPIHLAGLFSEFQWFWICSRTIAKTGEETPALHSNFLKETAVSSLFLFLEHSD